MIGSVSDPRLGLNPSILVWVNDSDHLRDLPEQNRSSLRCYPIMVKILKTEQNAGKGSLKYDPM